MSIHAPSGTIQANSPIMIGWGKSTVTRIDSVTLDFYVWTGSVSFGGSSDKPASPTFTIVQNRGFNDLQFVADISSYISPYLTSLIVDHDTIAPIASAVGQQVWCDIDYTVVGDWDGDTITTDTETGQVSFIVSGGTSRHIDGSNFEVTALFQHTPRTIELGALTQYLLPVDNSTSRAFRLSYGSNTFTFNSSISNQTNSSRQFIYVPLGKGQLYNMIDNGGGSVSQLEDASTITLEILNTETFSVVDTISIRYSDCYKYEEKQLVYKNRYGHWDSIALLGNSNKRSLNASASEYRGYIGSATNGVFSYSQSASSTRSYNMTAETNYTVNTGWMNEDNFEALQDIVMSDAVFLLEGLQARGNNPQYTIDTTLIPVLVDSKSINRKTQSEDKMISFTLQLRGTNNYENRIA